MDRGRVDELLLKFLTDNNSALENAEKEDKNVYDLVMNAITFISSKYGSGGVREDALPVAETLAAPAPAPETKTGGGLPFAVGDTFEVAGGADVYTYIIRRFDDAGSVIVGAVGGDWEVTYKISDAIDNFSNGTWVKVSGAGKTQTITPTAADAKSGKTNRVPSTDPSTWNAAYKVGDEVRIRVDFSNMDTNKIYTIKGYQDSLGDYNDGAGSGIQRPQNPSGRLYFLTDGGGSWEGKDLEPAEQANAAEPVPPAAPAATKTAPQKTPTANKTAAIEPHLFEFYVDRRRSKKGIIEYMQYTNIVREKGLKMAVLKMLSGDPKTTLTNIGEKKLQERYVKELLENGKLEKYIKLGDVFDTKGDLGVVEVIGLQPEKIVLFAADPKALNQPEDATPHLIVTPQLIYKIENEWERVSPNNNTGAGGDAQRKLLQEQIEALEPLAAADADVQKELDRLRAELAAIK